MRLGQRLANLWKMSEVEPKDEITEIKEALKEERPKMAVIIKREVDPIDQING